MTQNHDNKSWQITQYIIILDRGPYHIKGHIILDRGPYYIKVHINFEALWSKSYINWVDQTRVTQCGIKNSKIDTFYDF